MIRDTTRQACPPLPPLHHPLRDREDCGRPRSLLDRGGAALALVTLLFVLVGISPPSAASDLDTLRGVAETADRVVVATCVRSDSEWDPELRVIVTRVTLQAERYLKGHGDTEVTVLTLGGTIGKRGMSASHGAAFALDQQAIVFLRRSAHGPYSVVPGGDRGYVPVARSADGRLVLDGGAGASVEEVAAWLATMDADK